MKVLSRDKFWKIEISSKLLGCFWFKIIKNVAETSKTFAEISIKILANLLATALFSLGLVLAKEIKKCFVLFLYWLYDRNYVTDSECICTKDTKLIVHFCFKQAI